MNSPMPTASGSVVVTSERMEVRGRRCFAEPPEAALALALAASKRCSENTLRLCICRSDGRAERLAQALAGFAPDLDVIVLPGWDCLPYDRASPSASIMARRVEALRRLARPLPPAGRVLLTTPEAALQRMPPPSRFSGEYFPIVLGRPLSIADLKVFLVRAGYWLDERVDEPGEAAFRATIDIFPGIGERPLRLRLEEGVIVGLDHFDPSTQRREETLEAFELTPVSELVLAEATVRGAFEPEDPDVPAVDGREGLLLQGGPDEPRRPSGIEHWLPLYKEGLQTVFDLLPDAEVFLDVDASERIDAWLEQIADAFRQRSSIVDGAGRRQGPALPLLPPDRLYLDAAAWAEQLRERRVVELVADEASAAPLIDAEPVPRFLDAADPRGAFVDWVGMRRGAGAAIVLAAAEAADRRRLASLVERRLGGAPIVASDWQETCSAPPSSVVVTPLSLASGFASAQRVVFAFGDIFETTTGRATSSVQAAGLLADAAELRVGDLAVHPEHGIGRITGLSLVEHGDARRECVTLEYAGERKVLVPAEEMGRLWRYGSADAGVALDRLTGEAWTKRLAEVEAEVDEAARALVELARRRETARAPRLTVPAARYRRFAAGFPFTPTPDQAAAIEAVLADLARGRPMHRLVCGDVGYGKTEVALRAAAAAAFNGKQVLVLAPTRILVRQHLETFRRRFAASAIRVEAFTRATAAAAGRALASAVAAGEVGIVIATHTPTSSRLRFSDLALVVIDEEQRFGQRQKQQLQERTAGLHVLAMSATPIPRTLQAALAGVMEISVIATPPVRRRPVRTFVVPFDPAVVREALLREALQGGQSFFVCPRIADLEPMRRRLGEITPKLDVAVAHGKMAGDALEATVLAFADGRHDVLLTTDIIESGLDIPNANTMLVWRPDRFGLAELHQLRGRVGRGRRRGIVYLLSDPEARLAAATEKRLKSLQALDGLGGGFAVAAQDLDLRGAGDLLGEVQSGHMRLVGTDLWRHLLARAVRRARGLSSDTGADPDIRIGHDFAIPPEYLPEEDVRLQTYRRVAALGSEAEAAALAEELADRFGPPPPAVGDIIAFATVRALAQRGGVGRIDAGQAGIAFTFENGARGERLADHPELAGAKWSGGRLVLPEASSSPREQLERVRRLLRTIAEDAAEVG